MTDHSSASIPQPKNWQDFERNARVLFECILNDIHVQNNGRVGQPQHGVDIFGRRNGEGTKWVGVQCKGKDADYGGQVTEKEMRSEVEKSRQFTPAISDFILITTAPVDAAIQAAARTITEEREQEGNPLSVSVWGWGELESRICQYPRALQAFHPDATPYTGQILKNTGDLNKKADEHSDALKMILQAVQGIQQSVTVDTTSSGLELFDKSLHAEIDDYRNLLLDGRPLTALKLLENLKERIWGAASDRIKFRIITNIGSAKLLISKEKENEAIEHFLEAIKYQPEEKIALANVVLAYLLKGEESKAIEAAKIALEKDHGNTDAASYLIQAHIKDIMVDEPLELVPENIRQSTAVDLACIHFYRQRHDSRWFQIAREAGKRHPEAESILRFAAEAELENAVSTKGLLTGQKPPNPLDKDALGRAAATLQKLWEKQYHSELPGIDSSLPYNLAQIYRTLEDDISAKAVVAQAIEKMPESPDLIKLRAGFYLQEGRQQEALSLLTKHSDEREIALLIAEILAKNDPVSALHTLENFEQTEGIEPSDHIMAGHLRVDCWLTHPKLSKPDRIKKAEEVSNALLEAYPENPLALLIHSQVLEAAEEYSLSQEAQHRAKALLKSECPFYVRFMLANRFEAQGRYSDVADILERYVDSTHDSPALRMLFLALVNSDRRSQAHNLLQTIPAQVAQKPLFLRAAISLHFRRGDYPSAENAANKLLVIMPNDLRIHLDRIDIWIRCRHNDAINHFLSTEVETLEGKPEEVMRLAHLLDRFGFHERALKLGYKIHLQHRKNPELQLNYMGLLLRPSASERVNLHRVTVDLDTAFSIKNAAGETETFVIEEDDSLRIIDEAIPPSHLFAAAAMGLKEGEKFTTQHGEKWEIVSVKHKYIYSLHTKMEHFERLFPESRGLQRFRFDSADGEKSLEPLLQSIKERHDASERVLDLYSDSSLPLEIFTEGLGSDVIEAWYSLAQTRRKFKVCHGAAQERQVAMKCIKENNRAGCVVDALTLHIIRVLGIDKAITAVCGEIAATESTIETFRLRREQVLSYGGQPFMTLFWRDGQYFREEVTKERLEQTLDIIDRELNWIQQNVKVLPAESVKPVSDEVKRIRDEIAYWFLDPLLAAQGANQLLLCEDQSYRQFGVTEFNVKASWLQPALMLAFEQGAISHRKYYEAICDLVEAGHIFTSINAHILFYALRERESSFKTIADTLFGANAELASHLDVMMTFLSHIWIREHPSLSEKRATSILLRRLCFGEWTSNFSGANPNTILSSLEHNFTNRYFNKYLSGWRVGHIVTWSGNQSQENKAIKNAQNTET